MVTGGAGYIGSVVASQLLAAGHEVTVLDDLSTGHEDAVPAGARFVRARVSEASPTLAGKSYDGVLHFAAKSLVAESVARPELYWRNNVVESLALIEAVRAHGVPRFVFSSTAAVYGEPDVATIDEQTPAVPINAYGQSKLAVDFMLGAAARAHGLAVVSLRYFNVGGAMGDLGERHKVETHLIPNVLVVATGSRATVSVFGTDFPTPDGSAVRDYLHVVDLGTAHLLALDAARAGTHSIYNLGSGTGYSVNEVIEACRSVTGHRIPSLPAARRQGDPARLVASNGRIGAQLGWSPEAGLLDIVADAWAFMKGRQS
ncbi:UDP-glucose 4-epimerase GalE [Phycicoccus sp. Soil802]|uniref:UDP-glucose 4-epimerase GalE n=1 Tax=Phycicoccus sp. Soil802 TaxID=1736414 RepID=UPI001F312DA9|nr:UDP-glucose 4-epimerase GalE [Phycicoccus sp. Soil802]